MKFNKKYYLLFILISLLFIIPIKVNATSYKSDYVLLKVPTSFNTEKFTIYTNHKIIPDNTPEQKYSIELNAIRKNKDIYFYHYIIYFYNTAREEIGALDGYNGMWFDRNNSPQESTFKIYLDQSAMYNDSIIANIRYYKLFIEPSTKEMVDNYLYNNTKLNPNGLDDISDFDTKEMIDSQNNYVNDTPINDNKSEKEEDVLSINYSDYIVSLIPIIFLVISIAIWFKYGRDEKLEKSTEYYPPNGLNSLEVGFVNKGEADFKDITSLIIYLANKGYIKISKSEESSKFEGYKITKLKEYDGKNEYEKTFIDKIFNKKNEVTYEELHNSYYYVLKEIIAMSKEGKDQFFTQNTANKRALIIFMIIISLFTIIVPPVIKSNNGEFLMFALFFQVFGLIPFFSMVFGETQIVNVSDKAVYSPITFKLGGIFCSIITIVIPFILAELIPILSSHIYIIEFIIGMICIIGMFICLAYLPKRSSYGNKLLSKVNGLKKFIIESKEIDEILINNQTYFYDLLPYAYVLNLSDEWINKVKSVPLKAPSWIEKEEEFDIVSLMKSTNDLTKDIIYEPTIKESKPVVTEKTIEDKIYDEKISADMDVFTASVGIFVGILIAIFAVSNIYSSQNNIEKIIGMVSTTVGVIVIIYFFHKRKERKNDKELLNNGQGILEIEEKKNKAKRTNRIFGIIGWGLAFLFLTAIIVAMNVVFIKIKQNWLIGLLISLVSWGVGSFAIIKEIKKLFKDE